MQRKMAYPPERLDLQKLGEDFTVFSMVSVTPKNTAALSPRAPSQSRFLRNGCRWGVGYLSTTGHLVSQSRAGAPNSKHSG